MSKIDDKLFSCLTCPHCRDHGKLTETASGLRCESCGRVFPVTDGVPDMLPDSGVVSEVMAAAT